MTTAATPYWKGWKGWHKANRRGAKWAVVCAANTEKQCWDDILALDLPSGVLAVLQTPRHPAEKFRPLTPEEVAAKAGRLAEAGRGPS